MSAGAFTESVYQSNAGTFHAVQIQPETLGLTIGGVANSPTVDPVDSPFPAIVSGGRRRRGILHTRTVTIRFTATPPTGYKVGGTLTLPILDPALWNSIDNTNKTGTYLTVACEVVFKTPEKPPSL